MPTSKMPKYSQVKPLLDKAFKEESTLEQAVRKIQLLGKKGRQKGFSEEQALHVMAQHITENSLEGVDGVTKAERSAIEGNIEAALTKHYHSGVKNSSFKEITASIGAGIKQSFQKPKSSSNEIPAKERSTSYWAELVLKNALQEKKTFAGAMEDVQQRFSKDHTLHLIAVDITERALKDGNIRVTKKDKAQIEAKIEKALKQDKDAIKTYAFEDISVSIIASIKDAIPTEPKRKFSNMFGLLPSSVKLPKDFDFSKKWENLKQKEQQSLEEAYKNRETDFEAILAQAYTPNRYIETTVPGPMAKARPLQARYTPKAPNAPVLKKGETVYNNEPFVEPQKDASVLTRGDTVYNNEPFVEPQKGVPVLTRGDTVYNNEPFVEPQKDAPVLTRGDTVYNNEPFAEPQKGVPVLTRGETVYNNEPFVEPQKGVPVLTRGDTVYNNEPFAEPQKGVPVLTRGDTVYNNEPFAEPQKGVPVLTRGDTVYNNEPFVEPQKGVPVLKRGDTVYNNEAFALEKQIQEAEKLVAEKAQNLAQTEKKLDQANRRLESAQNIQKETAPIIPQTSASVEQVGTDKPKSTVKALTQKFEEKSMPEPSVKRTSWGDSIMQQKQQSLSKSPEIQ